jgi:NAD(P)-dependent dehydrogenase (short-subunit alcohol dehydrogenase family)
MPNAFDLTGRVAVVVGGTTGIGRALALGLADAGADVVAAGRRAAMVAEVADAIETRGRRSLRVPADVGDAASLGALRDACLHAFGRVDVVVAAAGTTKRTASLEMSEADWQRIVDTNLTGMFRTYQVFAPAMIARGAGRLIGIGSIASFVGLQEVAAYTASKAAVAGLTRALSVEWARFGVRVVAIAPGPQDTPMLGLLREDIRQALEAQIPFPSRLGRPSEYAALARHIIENPVLNGETIRLDGALRMPPK